ncbi:homeobox-domain-containing protein [Paxillus ammoniavirescens]|nr:homeobox-domain-containing protein [Paxillus ammoniavirescens]
MSTPPTANIASKSPTPSPNRHNPSRRIEHDSPHLQLFQSTSGPSDPTVDLPSSYITSSASFHHPHPEQDVSTTRPTKRRRRNQDTNMAAEGASSMSDSSSQSGMADNETEAERSQQSERSAALVTAPQKKKRTRTLTTPHQSAVLHALLAKSRFPTTAMREEVGRQIGLSARKVQIWFQNQRQKARRPQGESAPLTRPPQFGPFTTLGSAGPSTSSYLSSSAGGGSASETPQLGPSSSRTPGPESKRSLDSNSGLSGPGIPGPPSYPRRPASAGVWEPSRQTPTSPESALAGIQQHRVSRTSEGLPPRDSRGSTHTSAPQPNPVQEVDRSPQLSRVLPPIGPSPLNSPSSIGLYVPAISSFPPQHHSRTSVNILQRHDSTPLFTNEQGSSASVNIPPPFTLQPQPQWDPQTFTPYTRPEFASWSNSPGSSLSARATSSAAGAHDRLTHNVSPNLPRGRHIHPSAGEHRSIASHRSQPFDPIHDIISPSRGQRLSPAPSRPSFSAEGHVGSDNEVGEH